MKIEIQEEEMKLLVAYAVIGVDALHDSAVKFPALLNVDLDNLFSHSMMLEDYYSQLKGKENENK